MRVTRTVFIVLLSIIIFTGMTCTGKKAGTDSVTQFPREQTLYLTGFIWSPPTSFNPLNEDPTFPMTGNVFLVYEGLFGYNQLTGELEGVIGKRYSISHDTVTVDLNEKAKWHDGSPLTSDDVLYTFELNRTYNTNEHSSWQYLSGIKAEGPYRVKIFMSRENFNPLIVKELLGTILILPKSVFKKLEERAIAEVKAEKKGEPSSDDVFEKMIAFKNDSLPMGSGPYSLYAYSDQKVVLQRVDTYWGNVLHNGKLPAPKYLVHPIFKSNDAANLALVQGQIDVSQNFVPQIYNRFKKGVGTWFRERPFFIPGTIPCMLMGLTKPPFNEIAFRRAIGFAVNYEQITNLSIYGYAPHLKPGLIIPFGPEQQYYNEADAATWGVSYNPDSARKILKAAGFTLGPDSLLVGRDGKKLPTFFVLCPSGWTDWESTCRIFVDGLRAVGIDVRERFVEESLCWKELLNGNFDFAMYAPLDYQSAATPWVRFNRTLSSFEWAPPGEVMYTNMGRYKDPVADSLLNLLPALTDTSAIKQVYRDLNIKFMKEMPVIPLMYRPWFFYEFSTRHWANFPTAENPTSPPQCLVVAAGISGLWNITPVGK